MRTVTVPERLDAGDAACRGGHWERARAQYDAVLDEEHVGDADRARAHHGIARCHWWLGEPAAAVGEATTAHVLYRRVGDLELAVECAVWLARMHKSDFDDLAAADSWLARADRLLEAAGFHRAWAQLVRAYRMPDLEQSERLTQQAWLSARDSGDPDLLVTALSQLGRIRVARGQVVPGMGLLDTAASIALGGLESVLDGADPVPAEEDRDLIEVICGSGSTLRRPESAVRVCCDMIRACEIVADLPRAARWRAVGDALVDRYGCPFLAAELRIHHGSIYTATGDWTAAERDLTDAVRITEGRNPRLHALAAWRLARLYVGQGRLDEAGQVLRPPEGRHLATADRALSLADLLLAEGDGAAAVEVLLEQLPVMVGSVGDALHLLVEAQLAADDVAGARATATELAALAEDADDSQMAGHSATASAHLAWRLGDEHSAIADLQSACHVWTCVGLPHEAAMARLELAHLTIARDRKTALTLARVSLEAFESMGAVAAEWATDLLIAHDALDPAEHPLGPGRGAPSVLTPRERRVLRLSEAGLDVADIGQRLYLSPRTAALHLDRIREKQAAAQLPDADTMTRAPGSR